MEIILRSLFPIFRNEPIVMILFPGVHLRRGFTFKGLSELIIVMVNTWWKRELSVHTKSWYSSMLKDKNVISDFLFLSSIVISCVFLFLFHRCHMCSVTIGRMIKSQGDVRPLFFISPFYSLSFYPCLSLSSWLPHFLINDRVCDEFNVNETVFRTKQSKLL